MSCRLTALSVFFLLYLLRAQSIDLTHTQVPSSPLDFDFPEIDGSAVDETCRIFSTPDTTTEVENTPPPITTKQVVATTEKPSVQMPPRTQETKDTGAQTRSQPKLAGPITNSQSDLAARLLAYLLANSRGHGANSLNSILFQPRLPYRSYSAMSDSDESAATLLQNPNRNRWKIRFSSEDSSDES